MNGVIIVSGRLGLRVSNENKWKSIRILWIAGVLVCFSYILTVYLLPIIGVGITPSIPLKILVEVILCSFPVLTGILWVSHSIRNEKIAIDVMDEYAVITLGKRSIVTSCFEITSVNTSITSDVDNRPSYNTAILLALRTGMAENSSIAFEVGVSNEIPFMRIFVTTKGSDLNNLKTTVKREATRTEAILLASVANIELRLLREKELEIAYHSRSGDNQDDTEIGERDDRNGLIVAFDGLPRVMPTFDTSQIGTLISSLLKQRYSCSFTCVFSRASSKREKKKMEREWKSIRQKEKTKDDSLEDQAVKRRLIEEYQDVEVDAGWFDTTAYLYIVGDDELANKDALKGLVLSIWGGEGSLRLVEEKPKRRLFYRLLTRRHLKTTCMHANKLAAYVNLPVQNLPVITSMPIPTFTIPSQDAINHELKVAKTVFEGSILGDVGIKTEWLREHIAVLGATGTGKTTFVKHLISELSTKTSVPWWIFDVKGSEYRDLVGFEDVLVLKPGLDSSFVIDIFDPGEDSEKRHSHVIFSILRELLKERSDSSELTPAMERLLRESIVKVVKSDKSSSGSVADLEEIILEAIEDDDRTGKMTRDALLNRLEILSREPLGSILSGGSDAVRIASLMNRRVILDLRYVASTGGMDAARLLYNLIAKRIFDYAMKRGITPDLRHVVVLEEASNLVPESYTRGSAADVTTGESMVMLQRATGQGVIVVSTRPNISSNILANTSTKVTFRLPYDSAVGGRFLSLDDEQERYLRVLKRGRALMVLPNTNAFEISTEPFVGPDVSDIAEGEKGVIPIVASQADTESSRTSDISAKTDKSKEKQVFDKLGELANHVVAFLAAKGFVTEEELLSFLSTLDSKSDSHELTEIMRDLLSLETIERQAISLIPGGFVFTIPGKGLEAVTEVIMKYILIKLEDIDVVIDRKSENELIVNDKALFILPEHIRASAMDEIIETIRSYMVLLGNRVNELVIIVRGSVAAAMLREILDNNEEFDAVVIASAFTSSLDAIIDSFKSRAVKSDVGESSTEPTQDRTTSTELINAVHDLSSSSGRAIQMRLWFGLLQDFVDVSNGCVGWDVLMEFMETTAIQSIQGRTAPMNMEDGRRALTELLADEVLVALRIGEERQVIDLESGLWIVNSSILENLKKKSIEVLEGVLSKVNGTVLRNHGYYDLCAGDKSYVVFPTQQQLNTLLNLHSDVACRKCNSREVIVILTASEYVDDNYMTPENLKLATMADSMSTLII